jgi:hypothetical protein
MTGHRASRPDGGRLDPSHEQADVGRGGGLLGGCAVGGVSSHLVVPRASAQQAATLTKSEYFCTDLNRGNSATARANRLAIEGWELAGIADRDLWCWKRPKM